MPVIVTGASRGIGRAIAEHLHAAGLGVVGVARNVDLDVPFPMIGCDVGDTAQVAAAAAALKQQGMVVEGLINAAGIAVMNLAVATPPATSARVIGVNLLGTIYVCQALLPLMIRAGGGFVVNFSSIAVALGLAGEASYVAAKAGVEAYTRVLAREVAGFGITANCIAPGPIETDLLAGVSTRQRRELIARQVVQQTFTVHDICDLVDLLRDARSRSISGQVLHVGGV